MTIKEIAQLCGVSRGTVDRVINRRGRVKPETEALILRTLKSEGYTKNIVGRALTVRRSAPVIGVIL
ncbi:MAG: LacI family DNA-binding transcriptional regulator, partial [Clostridia bacterium]